MNNKIIIENQLIYRNGEPSIYELVYLVDNNDIKHEITGIGVKETIKSIYADVANKLDCDIIIKKEELENLQQEALNEIYPEINE